MPNPHSGYESNPGLIQLVIKLVNLGPHAVVLASLLESDSRAWM